MQTLTTILFTALILGFLLLFLLPGRWWPRKPPRRTLPETPPKPIAENAQPDTPEPRRYTGYLN